MLKIPPQNGVSMPAPNFAFYRLSTWMFLISFILLGILGCGSHRATPAPVTELNWGKPENNPGYYLVQPGDTLYSISWRYGIKIDDLCKINGLSDMSRIRVGQKLALAPPVVTTNTRRSKLAVLAVEPVEKSADHLSRESAKTVCCLKNKSSYESVAQKSDKSIKNFGWLWPVKGRVVTHFMAKSVLNKGIDIQSKLGEPVLAASDGEVVYAGSGLRDYGQLVILKHADKYLSAYGNNNLLLVQEGQKVRAGQKIAEVGSGYQGVMLHFEIRYDGQPIDPLRHLPPL